MCFCPAGAKQGTGLSLARFESHTGPPEFAPKPDELREFRRVHGMSTQEAGELVHVTAKAWERWEAGERPMHPAFFELARLKVRMIQE